MTDGLTNVATAQPDGSDLRWLGALGHVTPAVYSKTLPGGCNQLTCTLQREPTYRSVALNPGRLVQAYRGGSCVWNGTLLEPTPSSSGWAITGNGSGNAGANYDAIYTTWTNQNDAINQAITRGLPWVNPGVPSGVWLGQQFDSGQQTIADLLNLFCTMGGYTWYVGRNNILSVYPWTTSPVTRYLTCTAPVPRTLGGDINVLNIRYQITADGTNPATFGLTQATVPASIAVHGRIEKYVDLSNAGVMTAGAAQALGNSMLLKYQRASFAGPFIVRYGQYLLPGGQPVDLGCEEAGPVVQLIITDFGYGGEVVPAPVTFVVGSIEYDDGAGTASIVPYQSIDLSLDSLLGTIGAAGGTAAQEKTTPSLAGTAS